MKVWENLNGYVIVELFKTEMKKFCRKKSTKWISTSDIEELIVDNMMASKEYSVMPRKSFQYLFSSAYTNRYNSDIASVLTIVNSEQSIQIFLNI